jgi:6,7-dimethyl-8-ribityllumazine synthase
MKTMREQTGQLHGAGRRFGVVASRFNGRIVEDLLHGALDCLLRHGVDAGDTVVARVPGAWEVPQALDALARQGGLDGLVALGAVIRGETAHFELVAAECARGAAAVALRYGLPVGFGVLVCDTSEQAAERAGGKLGNKGWDAALASLELADLFVRLHRAEPAAALSRRG